MKKYLDIIRSVPLFSRISFSELEAVLECLGVEIMDVKKGGVILLAGHKSEHLGVVLSGQIHIVKEDINGNRILVAVMSKGEVFGETLCYAGVEKSPVTVLAGMDCTVMMIRFNRILHTCSNACEFHTKIIENMLGMIVKKTLMLQNRIEIISMKSLRMKVLHYLESFIPEQGRCVTIPFNREELADYLCVDRSALSHELARMKSDGLIEYKKNRFLLK